ncbi:MAG: discoidin domain-containing protein [Hyphomicrobiaceae bacterium]|nr:discoidin domain-containing protein [Nitrospirales bacterium]
MTIFKRSVMPYLSVLVLNGWLMTPVLSASNIPPKIEWKVSASSVQSDEFQPGYLADSDTGTRWSSQPKEQEWVYIDLGRVVEIAGFTLNWEHAYASKYRLLVSTDGREWTTVYENDDSDGKMDDIYIRPVSGQYVRLDTKARATGWGHSLWELDVKGTEELVEITAVAGGGENVSTLMDGRRETVWKSEPVDRAELLLDLRRPRTISGLRIDWDQLYASSVDMAISTDGKEWKPIAHISVSEAQGQTDFLSHEAAEVRYIRLVLANPVKAGGGFGIGEISLRGPTEAFTPFVRYQFDARKAPFGDYPLHLLGHQTYWTLVGLPKDSEESLFDEYGNLEFGRDAPSLMAYVKEGEHLYSAATAVNLRQELDEGYLPVPVVLWETENDLYFRSEAITSGSVDGSITYIRHRLTNHSDTVRKGEIIVTIRPAQINPKWQYGGLSPIRSIRYVHETGKQVMINDKNSYVSLSPADRFLVTQYAHGDIANLLRGKAVPTAKVDDKDENRSVQDETGMGLLSAAWIFAFDLNPGEFKEVVFAAPLHETLENLKTAEAFGELRQEYVTFWTGELNRVGFELADQAVVDTVKSQLAYILLTQDGVVLQPGARSYNRTWMRDGAMIASTMMRLGFFEEAKEYLDWYAERVEPDGLVPPILDTSGTVYDGWGRNIEWDSQGQFIYAIMEYYRFTGDREFLEKHFDAVRRAMTYLVTLRERTLDPEYYGKIEAGERLKGILPPSISHEGFIKPVHSYWDDFWAIRGWADGSEMAEILGREYLAGWAKTEGKNFSNSVKESIEKTIAWKSLDYIPVDADRGTPDPTSIAIALFPTEARHVLPADILDRTFRDYYRMVKDRDAWTEPYAYAPYELRNILALTTLGFRLEAFELHEILFRGRRPATWNQFAEVVHSDSRKGAYIGDMPHTWVGSDYVNAVRGLILMEEDEKKILNLLFGTPREWLVEDGIALTDYPTHFGTLTMQANWEDGDQRLSLDVEMPKGTAGKIYVRWPIHIKGKPAQVTVEGEKNYHVDNNGIWLSAPSFKLVARW